MLAVPENMTEEVVVRKKKSALPDANGIFDRVSDRMTNAEVIDHMSKRVIVRTMVVSCLIRINTRSKESNWWQDTDLMTLFKNMYFAGVLPLPNDPVKRIRWIAFLCKRACEVESYDCGVLLLPLDYLPDDQLDGLPDRKPQKSIRATVKKLRSELRDKGWDSVFGW